MVFRRFQRNQRVILFSVRTKDQEQQVIGQCTSYKSRVRQKIARKGNEWDSRLMKEEEDRRKTRIENE